MKLIGYIKSIHYSNNNNGWTILTLQNEGDSWKCSGVSLQNTIGSKAELTGEFQNHPKYGRQFIFQKIEIIEDKTKEGVLRFLLQLPGIGPVIAEKMAFKFGDKIWDILKEKPERLSEISGITSEKAQKIHEDYLNKESNKNLLVILMGYGLTGWQISQIIKQYNDPLKMLRENPYQMIEDIDGFGFLRVDEIAVKSGTANNAPNRISAGILYAFEEISQINGHIYLSMPYLLKEIIKLFQKTHIKLGLHSKNVSEDEIKKVVFELIENGKLILIDGMLYEKKLLHAEQTIMEFISVSSLQHKP